MRPGTNRLPLVPYEHAMELHKNVDFISWYIQHQGEDNTWIGGGRVDENRWKMSMANGYEERYSVLRGNGTLEIRNVTSHDDGALYLGTVLGEYNGQLQYRLQYFDPNAAQRCPACPKIISNLNCTVCNCSISDTFPGNDTQTGEHGAAGMSIGCKVGLSLLSAFCIILIFIVIMYRRRLTALQIVYRHRLTALAKAQMALSDGVNHGGEQRDKSGIDSTGEMDSDSLYNTDSDAP